VPLGLLGERYATSSSSSRVYAFGLLREPRACTSARQEYTESRLRAPAGPCDATRRQVSRTVLRALLAISCWSDRGRPGAWDRLPSNPSLISASR
jgi:hypothetical protein